MHHDLNEVVVMAMEAGSEEQVSTFLIQLMESTIYLSSS